MIFNQNLPYFCNMLLKKPSVFMIVSFKSSVDEICNDKIQIKIKLIVILIILICLLQALERQLYY